MLRTFIEYFGAGTELLDIYSEEGRVTFTSYTEKVMNDMGLRFLKNVAIDAQSSQTFSSIPCTPLSPSTHWISMNSL